MGKPITAEKLLGKIDSILNQGIIPLLGMVQKKRCLSNQKRCLENHLSKHKKVKEDCRISTDFIRKSEYQWYRLSYFEYILWRTSSSSWARMSTDSPEGKGVCLSTLYLNSSSHSIPKMTFLTTKVILDFGASNLYSTLDELLSLEELLPSLEEPPSKNPSLVLLSKKVRADY